MRDDHYNSHRHDDEDGQAVSKKEVDRFAQDAFKQAESAIASSKIGETKKLFGLVEMDAGIVNMVNGVYNMGADYFSNQLRPRAFDISSKLATRWLKVSEPTAKTIGVATAIGSTALMKMGGYFGDIYRGFADHLDDRRQLAHDIAPVLDDIKGGHSVFSLQRVGAKDNEVIYAHRTRIGKMASAQNTSNILEMAVNSGASLLMDGFGLARIWKGRADPRLDAAKVAQLFRTKNTKASEEQAKEDIHGMMAEISGGNTLKTGFLGLLPTISKRYVASSQHKLAKELSPYSALEMILELQQQAGGNSDVSRIQEPRNYKDPHARRHEFSLEEYLVRIFIQHQKDMAWLKPEAHTEIRQSLVPDLTTAVRPLAKAIRSGEVSPMSLVRLVGEGHIIQKHGRAIATLKEIQALIDKEAPKQPQYDQADPAEHFDEAKGQNKEHNATQGKTRVEKTEYHGRIKDNGHDKHEDGYEDEPSPRRGHVKYEDKHREMSDEREIGYGY